MATAFGWAVHGRSQAILSVVNCSQVIVLRAAVSDQENTAVLRGFWELESMGVVDAEVQDHSASEIMQRFEGSITKSDRRYEVSLPWKPDVKLDCNREMAWKRLESQRKRLIKNPELMQRYDQAVRLYFEDGMAERVEREEDSGERVYYMPHQAVLREGSSTTKMRIVFDASSHGQNCKSLNDNLESGPNLNPDLVSLLLNFRQHLVALVADVEKAFLQIEVNPEDRNALRFLWYKEPPQPNQTPPEVDVWRMTRVIFGATSSPFLLVATLRHHFKEMKNVFPRTAERLGRSV